MSTTHTALPYKRYTRQVSSGPSAVIAAGSLAEINYLSLQDADWVASTELASSMPPLNFTSNPVQASFDAYKYVSDYSDGKQNAYAGMVAYRFELPADAVAGTPADVVSIATSLYVDRWLIGGARISAYLSDSDAPSSDWTTLTEGDIYATAQLPATDPRSDQSDTITLTFPGSSTAMAYLYVVLSLEDYVSPSPLDARRIEGGALVVGQSVSVEFSRSVTADTETVDSYLAQPIFYSGTLTQLSRSFSVYSDIGNVLDYPEGWWSALTVWSRPDLMPSLAASLVAFDRAALKRRDLSGTICPFVTGSWHRLVGRVGTSVTLKSLYFENSIPTPDAGVVLKLVVYGLMDRPADSEHDIDKSSYKLSSFWNGSASQITFSRVNFPDETIGCSPILVRSISEGYASTYPWPIDFTPDDYYGLIVVCSPERITSNPGSTVDTWYGIQWTPGNITLKP